MVFLKKNGKPHSELGLVLHIGYKRKQNLVSRLLHLLFVIYHYIGPEQKHSHFQMWVAYILFLKQTVEKQIFFLADSKRLSNQLFQVLLFGLFFKVDFGAHYFPTLVLSNRLEIFFFSLSTFQKVSTSFYSGQKNLNTSWSDISKTSYSVLSGKE